eukprot:TRINITY_DN5038_c0_g1_i1.p1 TRINITY_DN5038_c0_g1~~TRINITY_DN5038_c0_g1_i1.p1  ORF type:complete len:384 (+),score=67.74 TRINITY_DN5038_c0_g1_i1:22-1173(+)
MSDPIVSITISDTTLKEQANLKIKPEKLRVNGLIERLHPSNEENIVRKACDELAHYVFIPWLNKQNQANKMYFCKQGGLKLLVHWMKEAKDPDTQADAGTAVWNFSESAVMQEILWKEGAGHALFDFLKSGVPRKERVAIGALFGLFDYGSNNPQDLPFSTDTDLVKKILDTKQEGWSFNLAKAGCLLSLSKYPTMRQSMVENGAITQLLENKNDELIDYLQALSIAHLIAGNHTLDSAVRNTCLQSIERHFDRHPSEIRKKESRHGIVWSSTKHLLRLLRDDDPTIRLFALHCSANLSYGDYNRALMQEEDLIGPLFYSQWVETDRNEKQQECLAVLIKNFGASDAVPSLFQICSNGIMNRTQFTHVRPVVEELFPEVVTPM